MNNMEFAGKVATEYHKNLVNLLEAIQKAGGSVSSVTPETTVHELLMCCSTNSIELSAVHKRSKE